MRNVKYEIDEMDRLVRLKVGSTVRSLSFWDLYDEWFDNGRAGEGLRLKPLTHSIELINWRWQ